jgi:hypothetical protein
MDSASVLSERITDNSRVALPSIAATLSRGVDASRAAEVAEEFSRRSFGTNFSGTTRNEEERSYSGEAGS